MSEPTAFYTAEMVRDLIDEDCHSPRYETVYGELLVTPAPNGWHQEVTARLFVALRAYLAREPGAQGHAYASPADVSWGRRDVLVQPDIFVVPTPPSLKQQRWSAITRLLLAVEIVSPSSRRADHFTKRRLYQAQGTPLYWVIDPGQETAEAWEPASDLPRAVEGELRWHPVGATEAFALSLGELFQDA